ncbi:hypothetical protein CKAH01_06085 [Colletotrichum kahawae]|uniref:Uncharacterized protein n=1 Tax=Colletotrichum kahawae TaxID=34407 RepID=A0AAE0D4B5_COLKA|nr:hypothetical protein CKAH01_06085 [Colletotrichum kahawae]
MVRDSNVESFRPTSTNCWTNRITAAYDPPPVGVGDQHDETPKWQLASRVDRFFSNPVDAFLSGRRTGPAVSSQAVDRFHQPRTTATMSMRLASIPLRPLLEMDLSAEAGPAGWLLAAVSCQTPDNQTLNNLIPCRHVTHNSNDLQRLHLVRPSGRVLVYVSTGNIPNIALHRARFPSLHRPSRLMSRQPISLCLPKRVGGRTAPPVGPNSRDAFTCAIDGGRSPPLVLRVARVFVALRNDLARIDVPVC